jgi:hypothetical protein
MGGHSFKGLSDASERKARTDPYWIFDWDTGEKKMASKDADRTTAP